MGLDMHFIAVPRGERISETKNRHEIFYFRKHADLNGFLQEIWLKEHPRKNPEDFNCKNMRITEEILDRMKDFACMSDNDREHYSGFFWGESTEDDWRDTRERCIPAIEQAMADGNNVYYHPWW